jgi:hypothetical protein
LRQRGSEIAQVLRQHACDAALVGVRVPTASG